MTRLIKIDFSKHEPINMNDRVNLRDIYTKLVERGAVSATLFYPNWVRSKLKYYAKDIDFFTIDKNVKRIGTRGSSLSTDHFTTVQVAMEIVANGHKEAGHEMRRFLTNCLKLNADQSQHLTQTQLLLKAVSILADQEKEIREIKQETPRIVQSQIEAVLEDKYSFPEDCMRIGEILTEYFPGVARDKVLTYLRKKRHPRGNHVHIDENGIKTVSHPFKAEGLQELSKAFFEERKLIRETAKCRFYFHPMAGNMREYI